MKYCCSLFLVLAWSQAASASWSSSSSTAAVAAFRRGSKRISSPWFSLPRGGARDDEDNEGQEATTTPTSPPLGSSLSSGGATYAAANAVDYYTTQLESVKSQVLANSAAAITELRNQIMDQGKVVVDFGSQADMICNQALEEFASLAPPAKKNGASQDTAAYYDRALQQLEAALDAPLQVLYMKQLSYLRETALQRYRTVMKTSSDSSGGGGGGGPSEYEAMLQVDANFVQQAEALRRSVPSAALTASGAGGDGWDYEGERSFLQVVMSNIAESGRKSIDVQINAANAQQTTMQFLQAQQQMIQQLQMQLYGQSSPWNVGVAYRIPDTNFNLQGSYQQGRANVQLSCVPDEYAAFLGPNGFTNGVGPGNLGVSLNLSI